MTNAEIIATMKDEYGIEEEVNTYAGWKRAGYQVIKGEKATFKALIWKPKKVTKKDKDGKEKEENKMIRVWGHYFTQSQVEAKQTKKKQ